MMMPRPNQINIYLPQKDRYNEGQFFILTGKIKIIKSQIDGGLLPYLISFGFCPLTLFHAISSLLLLP